MNKLLAPAGFFLRIASESEKVFVRIFVEFLECSGLPKISIFRWTIQNFMTLTPPPVFREITLFIGKTKRKINDDLQCNESFKRISKRISIGVCGLYIYLCVVGL